MTGIPDALAPVQAALLASARADAERIRADADAAAERTVATVSHWQVRQPLYASSVGRWRNYADHLGPLLAILGSDDRSNAAARSAISYLNESSLGH